MKKNSKVCVLTNPFVVTSSLAVLLNAALWGVVFAFFPLDLPAAILHYNVAVGIDFVGEGRQILLLPSAGVALIVLDAILAYMLRGASQLSGMILMGSAAVAQVLLLVAFVALLVINA